MAGESVSENQDLTWSQDEETFHCDTLGELIDTYRDSLEVGQVVYFGEKAPPNPAAFFSADDLIDYLNEQAYDSHGECAEDWPEATEAAKAEFDTFLAAWIAKHCPPRFYGVKNIRPYTLTAEDLQE